VVFSSQTTAGDQTSYGEAYVFAPGINATGALVPLNARAMGAMHARHGIRRWEQLVSPGEQLARFGHAVSRAFARDISVASRLIGQDAALSLSVANRDGQLAGEGDIIVQEALSAVLAGVRGRGAGYMYKGPFAERLAEAYGDLGVSLTKEQIWNALPEVGDAITVPIGEDVAYFPPPPEEGGLMAAQLWQMLTAVEDYNGLAGPDRPHLLAEASLAVFAERTARAGRETSRPAVLDSEAPDSSEVEGEDSEKEILLLEVSQDHVETMLASFDETHHGDPKAFPQPPVQVPSDPYVASFVVADRWGDAAACSFTMNGLFGSGRVAPETGIIVPGRLRPGSILLTPVIVGNENTGDLRFAGAASGGLAAPIALVQVMLGSLDTGGDLYAAIEDPRVLHVGAPDVTWYEPKVTGETLSELERRGHELREAPNIGEVVALYCPGGILDKDDSCQVAVDPRGFGLAGRVQ
jgi:gamma-glutamyltranspeptidase/glutathione hydrolase